MLYVAFFKIKPGLTAGSPEIIEQSRKWWDGGGKPAGLKTVGVFSCLGTETRDVLIFETQSEERLVSLLQALPVAQVFLRVGKRGSFAISGRSVRFVPSIAVRPVDVTGGGNAYSGVHRKAFLSSSF